MPFEWDAEKARSNLRKHGVDLADAVGVFHDPLALSRPDEAGEEERWVALGMDFLGRILTVVYTLRGDDVRIISAREATRAERRSYETGLT
jgi:uncharacterized DUF497 family protein